MNIYMSQGLRCQMTQKLHPCLIFIRIFMKLWFWAFFYEINNENVIVV